MENRIKECQLDLFAGWASAATMRAKRAVRIQATGAAPEPAMECWRQGYGTGVSVIHRLPCGAWC
jgi:hypothetical protein